MVQEKRVRVWMVVPFIGVVDTGERRWLGGSGHECNFRPILFEMLRDVSIYSSMPLIVLSLVTS